MIGHAYSCSLIGIEAVLVNVETQINNSLKKVSLIGQVDPVLKEAKDRVRCAMEYSGLEFPCRELVINLAPVSLPKQGSGFDLAIALSILSAQGLVNRERLQKYIILGELALDGRVKPCRGLIAAACLKKQHPKLELLVAAKNAKILKEFPEINAKSVRNLLEAVSFINGTFEPEEIISEFNEEKEEEILENFSDVIGQHVAKRAALITAAGGHNLLMIGPPGSGKSMIAKRIIGILPQLSLEEKIEVSRIYEAHTLLSNTEKNSFGLIRKRQFRCPHSSTSVAGLIGGGSIPLPGEISLAHKGVLFLDEFPELRREVIESLRQPLENKEITVSRAKLRVNFPADFILIAAMNPCPCGNKGISLGSCKCSAQSISRYLGKISAPILDRIDLQVWVSALKTQEMTTKDVIENSSIMRERILLARALQEERLGKNRVNSSMTVAEINQFCELESKAFKLLSQSIDKLKLSTRAYHRILKLARTITDIERTRLIKEEQIAEALSYRLQ